MKTKELFISNLSIANDFIKQYEYPYQVLPNIKEFIIELGNSLNKDYHKIDDNIWIHKSSTINKTAEIYNCSKSTIAQILKKHNIPIISAEEHAKEKGYTIKQFDKNHKYLKSFNNIIDAAQEIINSNKGTTIKATREAIRIACLSGYLTYGFYWINDEYNDEYIKSYNNKTKNRKQNKKPSPQIPCPLCGNLMSSHSTICISCHNQQNSDNAIKEKQEKGITREFLKQEIRNKSFTQIGKEQGVSDNAIRKWCKLYNLPSKTSEIKKYSDKEWENL
jgi:hypothetical protein